MCCYPCNVKAENAESIRKTSLHFLDVKTNGGRRRLRMSNVTHISNIVVWSNYVKLWLKLLVDAISRLMSDPKSNLTNKSRQMKGTTWFCHHNLIWFHFRESVKFATCRDDLILHKVTSFWTFLFTYRVIRNNKIPCGLSLIKKYSCLFTEQ